MRYEQYRLAFVLIVIMSVGGRYSASVGERTERCGAVIFH